MNAPVLFGAEKEVGEQNRDGSGGQADDACRQGKKTEGVIRPRGEQARQNKIQLYKRGAEWENASQ
jgi:hypothetical protein